MRDCPGMRLNKLVYARECSYFSASGSLCWLGRPVFCSSERPMYSFVLEIRAGRRSTMHAQDNQLRMHQQSTREGSSQSSTRRVRGRLTGLG